MNLDEHKTVMRRMRLLIAFAAVIVGLYVFRLIFLQLVNGDSFKARATNTTDYHFTVTAARGDIVDSEGKRIAASTTSYNVVLSKLLMGGEDLDAMLQRIVELLEQNGESWNDSPPHQRAGCQRPLYVYGCGGQHQRPEEPCQHERGPGPAAVRHR